MSDLLLKATPARPGLAVVAAVFVLALSGGLYYQSAWTDCRDRCDPDGAALVEDHYRVGWRCVCTGSDGAWREVSDGE